MFVCSSHGRPATHIEIHGGDLLCAEEVARLRYAVITDGREFRSLTEVDLHVVAPEHVCRVPTCDAEPHFGRTHAYCVDHVGVEGPDPTLIGYRPSTAAGDDAYSNGDRHAIPVELVHRIVWVHYAQFTVEDAVPSPPPVNRPGGVGLVGAVRGRALFTTGTHTGRVRVDVAVATGDPGPDDSYEDIVEIDFIARTQRVMVVEWGNQVMHELPPLPNPPGTYRLRYHATGMDEGHARDTTSDPGGHAFERYLIQMWPSDPAPPAILRTRSQMARYWQTPAEG
jgi:hypothetical protein